MMYYYTKHITSNSNFQIFFSKFGIMNFKYALLVALVALALLATVDSKKGKGKKKCKDKKKPGTDICKKIKAGLGDTCKIGWTK